MPFHANIIWYESLDSTNSEALRNLPSLKCGDTIAARFQTAGKGQRGNSWKSAAGDNLTFSMVLKFGDGPLPPIPAKCQFSLSEASTITVRDYLTSKGVRAQIKWPNDIYVANKKICGMLLENQIGSRAVLTGSIVGIGINMNQTEFDPGLMNPVSLKKLTKKDYDIEAELQEICRRLSENFSLCATEEGRAALHENYLKDLYRLDMEYDYTDCMEGCPMRGKIVDVSPTGMLKFKTNEGKLKEFAFKEISYII